MGNAAFNPSGSRTSGWTQGAKRPFAITLAAIAFLILCSAIDGIGGRVPQVGTITAVMRIISNLGNGITLTVISLGLYIYGMTRKESLSREAGLSGFYAVLMGSGAVHLMKAAFERTRPSHASESILHFLHNPSLFDLTGRYNSFPSGHTTVSFAVAYVLARRFPRFAPAFYILASLVALSRVYLGSHYPSDIGGGVILGLAVGYLLTGGPDGRRAPKGKWLFAGLLFLTVFISFFKTGGFFVFDVDEAVFSEASREMVETGDLITPTYNYEPRYDKPILIYWFMSASFALMGLSEFSARFTSSGFGVLLVIMTFFFVKKLKGDLTAYVAAAVLLLNLEFFVYSHSAVTDMTLCFFITASLYAFYLGVSESDRKWFALAWAASALAVLTKGVIGLLFPAAVALIYLTASFNLRRIKDVMKPAHIVLFIAIAAPWFIAEYSVNGWEFIDEFIVKHHIKRYAGVISSHSGPFYYYILIILAGFFPWVVFIPRAVKNGVKEFIAKTGGLNLFSLLWFLFVLVFFSAAKTKLPNYIFPLYPPMAIMASVIMVDIINNPERKKKPGLFLLTMLSLVLSSAFILLPAHDVKMDVEVENTFFFIAGGIFLLLAGSSIAAFSNPKRGLQAIAGLTAILLIFLRIEAVPVASLFLQETLYEYSAYARDIKDEARLATYEINRPSIAFYSRGGFLKVEQGARDKFRQYRDGEKIVVITTPERLPELENYIELTVIDSTEEFVLAANTAELPPFKEE